MNTFLKIIIFNLIMLSISACCERRCGIQKPIVQEQLRTDVPYKLEKMKSEKGDK